MFPTPKTKLEGNGFIRDSIRLAATLIFLFSALNFAIGVMS